MDKKFLAEKTSREKSEYRNYLKSSIKNPNLPYPPHSRFGDIKHPIVQAEPHIFAYDDEKIWSQIPFAGTLVLSLLNVPEEKCLFENGFEPSDIPKLIELSKETSKNFNEK